MYIYAADTWCDSCGEEIRRELDREGMAPADPSDEWSYDSDDYPKSCMEEETDHPDHCAAGAECLEAVDLGDYGLASDAELYGAEGRKVGAILSDGLTEEGIRYTLEMMAPPPLTYGLGGIGTGAIHHYRPTPYQKALYALWRETFNLPEKDA